jgi:hypothetical protein
MLAVRCTVFETVFVPHCFVGGDGGSIARGRETCGRDGGNGEGQFSVIARSPDRAIARPIACVVCVCVCACMCFCVCVCVCVCVPIHRSLDCPIARSPDRPYRPTARSSDRLIARMCGCVGVCVCVCVCVCVGGRVRLDRIARSPDRPSAQSTLSPDRPIARSSDRPIARSPDRPIARPPDRPIARSPDHRLICGCV